MKIGYCYAVCDILHDGHIDYFKNSKALCDYLVCGVMTNESLVIKPKPIMSFESRIAVVKAIKYIDLVVPQHMQSPLRNLKKYNVDVLFESITHLKFDFIKKASAYMINNNKQIYFTGVFEGRSSSLIKEKILETRRS